MLKAKVTEYDAKFKFTEMTGLIRGAKEMKTLINEDKGKRDSLSEGVFLFCKAVNTYAGAFNKQHGNKELTNDRGIDALRHADAIAALTRTAYRGDPLKQAKVNEVMDWFETMAGYLFEMSTLMKSQKKLTPERLERLEISTIRYGIAWKKKVTWKNPVFWKMHTHWCCLLPFANETGMCGIVSAEGSENKHHHMATYKRLLAPIVSVKNRVNKISQRQQIRLIPGISKSFKKIERKKGARRGTYNNKGQTRNQEEVPVDDALDTLDADEYFKTAKGNFLPSSMREIYNFYERSHIPDSWYETFDTNESLGNMAKRKTRFHI